MNWFQRYGIPGAYFCGILTLWFAAFYNCAFDNALKSDNLIIIGGIAVASFVPIGYLLCLIGQIIYHLTPIGIDTRARAKKKVNAEIKCPWTMEWEQEIWMFSKIIEKYGDGAGIRIDVAEIIIKWMSKRMDMIVINFSLMIGTMLAPIIVFFLPVMLGLVHQPDKIWFWFTVIIGGAVFAVTLTSWLILTNQLAHFEKKVLLDT